MSEREDGPEDAATDTEESGVDAAGSGSDADSVAPGTGSEDPVTGGDDGGATDLEPDDGPEPNGSASNDGEDPPYGVLSTVLLSVLAGLGGFAASYGVAGRSAGYLLEPFASLLTTYAPPVVLRYLRNEIGSTLRILTAGGMAVVAVAVVVFLALRVAERTDRRLLGPPLAAIGTAGFAFAATGVALSSVAAAVAAGLVVSVGEVGAGWSGVPSVSRPRRRLVSGVVVAGGIGILGRALGNGKGGASAVSSDPLAGESPGTPPGESGGDGSSEGDSGGDPTISTVDQDEVEELLSTAEENRLGIEGIEPLVSEDFYNVDIATTPPEIDAGEWSLSVTGEVGSERTVDYREVREMEYEHRFVTLRCVSDAVNGYKTDNALWTGIPAKKVMEGTDPQGEYVLLHGKDGYSVGFPLAAFQDGLLAYGMNGKVLPRAHGFPVRMLVPGHWGETNMKWITEIEVTDELQDGYWEKKGWEGTGPVHTVAKVHAVNRLGDGRIEVGGHAYAGTRGVSAVEVSIDGGESWQEAQVSEDLSSEDVWRQYRFEYDAPGEKHEVLARAIEDDGTIQTEETQDDFPGGATGYASKTVNP